MQGQGAKPRRIDDNEVDENGLPPAPKYPECDEPMELESFKGDGRLQVAYVCPVHGVGWTFDPFEDE